MNARKKQLYGRLHEVISLSYRILRNKIAAGAITIHNEASLQMQLGTILNQVGQLYLFARNEHFEVNLEVPKEIDPTVKSARGKARCDIDIKLTSGAKMHVEAIIELKCFIKKQDFTETITMNRYAVLCDIENLEKYKNALCYEIIYTNNANYSKPNSQDFSLSNNGTIHSYEGDKKHKKVNLKQEYPIKWDIYEDKHYFLKVDIINKDGMLATDAEAN
ncbi:MAG: hypothetical protein ACI35T_05995 [Alistipes sp.]